MDALVLLLGPIAGIIILACWIKNHKYYMDTEEP